VAVRCQLTMAMALVVPKGVNGVVRRTHSKSAGVYKSRVLGPERELSKTKA